MRRFLPALTLLLLWAWPAHADTHAAASCNNTTGTTDVQDAINLASNGDIVTIPAGTCGWDVQVTVSVGITLQGAGAGTTIIQDDMAGSGNAARLLVWNCVSGQAHRITGIEFEAGTRATFASAQPGVIHINCTNAANTTFRFDNNTLDNLKGAQLVLDSVIGVVDNNTINQGAACAPSGSNGCDGGGYLNNYGFWIMATDWDGVGSYGDRSWFDGVSWGSSEFVFIENNTITHNASDEYVCKDGYWGARGVLRFNTTSRCNWEIHGTESSGRIRGGLALEIYHNTMAMTNGDYKVIDLRSGSAMIFSNALTNATQAVLGTLNNNRTVGQWNQFDAADGDSAWDINDAANPQDSGTTTSASGFTITDTGKAWTPGQWVGDIIVRTSGCTPSTSVFCHSVISGNTATTATYIASGFGINLSFTGAGGDSYEIREIEQVMDGTGRTGGSYVSGAPPSPPIGWNDQSTLPVYEWLNTEDGSYVHFSTTEGRCYEPWCAEDTHFFEYTTSFDCSTGVGVGTRATMDALSGCTNGVGFWVTDEGDWDLTDCEADDGQFYTWTGAAWTLYYEPYTYPHPLNTDTAQASCGGGGTMILIFGD